MTELFNSAAYFDQSVIAPSGFREYDARWVIEPTPEIAEVGLNYHGVRELGAKLGAFLQTDLDAGRRIIVGHDFRRYSENVKNALVVGLLQAGMSVTDIGLTTTPGAYFAQFALDCPCVAMVTASHNENGWTGIKMGHRLATTFGPDEMARFRQFTLAGAASTATPAVGGDYTYDATIREKYLHDLVTAWAPRFESLPRMRVAVETGNGTAGLYLPPLLERLGFTVLAGNTTPDWEFPNFNPNPESIPFLRSVEHLVRQSQADLGLCVDGDGDRLGLVTDRGELVFADRVGLLVAKALEADFGTERPIVIDVKSTSLYESELKSDIVWAKTGHSYVKSTVAHHHAIAGFERSGHYFFGEPLGRGYDDACIAALVVLWTLAKQRAATPGITISELLDRLPHSFSSPNRQPVVSDSTKYEAVERFAADLRERTELAGRKVAEVNELNGIRVTLEDRSWLLIRASSNSPNLVIIAETFDADGSLLRAIDGEVRKIAQAIDLEIGDFEPLYET